MAARPSPRRRDHVGRLTFRLPSGVDAVHPWVTDSRSILKQQSRFSEDSRLGRAVVLRLALSGSITQRRVATRYGRDGSGAPWPAGTSPTTAPRWMAERQTRATGTLNEGETVPAMAERTGGDVLFQFHPRKPATGMATTRAGQGSMTPSDLPLRHVGARRGFQVCRDARHEPCRPASSSCAAPPS